MTRFITALLLTSCFAAPALAIDFNASSKIDSVTVFPQGADVTRLADVNLPQGEHRIILADLPAHIDPQSIRVEGTGNGDVLIASVDSRSVFEGQQGLDAERLKLEKEIQALQAERAALDMAIQDATQQRSFLIGLADKQLVPQSSGENLKGIDVVQLGGLLDLVSQRLAALALSIQQAQAKQKAIDEKIQDLSNKIAQLAPGENFRTEVVINVETQKAVTGALKVSYRVREASWSPYYDARLTLAADGQQSQMELVRRAEVVQSTGEVWKDVKLTLSTARPTGATAAPELPEEEIVLLPKERERISSGGDGVLMNDAPTAASELEAVGGAGAYDEKKVSEKPKLMQQAQAEILSVGFQANYLIGARVSIDNSGQSKKVRIASADHIVDLEAIAVPRLDETAYLMAKFKLAGEGPQLPGVVNLYRDGVYVGQGHLPLLNPSEEAKLGFGADDLVKVTRKEVKRLSGEEGLLTTSNMEERVWDIDIKNLHGFAMPVTIVDRIPFASAKDIQIEEIPNLTRPTKRDVDKKRGVLSWTFKLEPQGEQVIKTGYVIRWPEGQQVGLVD